MLASLFILLLRTVMDRGTDHLAEVVWFSVDRFHI